MRQDALWHDTLEDALRAVVDALGGAKAVGSRMWPARNPLDAGRRLNHCLDPERREALTLGEFTALLQWGAEVNCHTAAHYLARACNYEEPKPIDPDTEQAKLQRLFAESVQQQKQILARMEALSK